MKKYFSTLMSGLVVFFAIGLPYAVHAASTTVANNPVYRLSKPGEHFWTSDMNEVNFVEQHGFTFEGIAYYVPATASGNLPVYRLNKPGEHFWTTDMNEVKYVESRGFSFEGIAYYVPPSATSNVPVYRLSKPGEHFWTSDMNEVNFVEQHGFTFEGIAYYVPATSQSTVVTADNLVPNPSVETNTVAGTPDNWTYGPFGTVSGTQKYNTTLGHTGTHSLGITLTSAAANSGAEWAFTPVAVTPGQLYQFSDWYQSSVDTEVDVAVTSGATTTYSYVGKVLASPGKWTQWNGQFVMPVGATSASFYAVISTPGTLTTDDYSMTQVQAATSGFNAAMVSVDFDDGWTSQFTNALPIITADKIPTTDYIISGEPTNAADAPDYMTWTQVKGFQSQGSEIGSHTVTHPDLTKLQVGNNTTQNTVDYELFQSQATINSQLGAGTAVDFASPDGAYNATVLAEIKKYYSSHRSVDAGFNSKDNFDVYNIHVESVTSQTPPSQIEAWIDEAIATRTWLVLVYHEVVTTETVGQPGGPLGGAGDIYHTEKADFQAEMDYINAHRSQITPMTTRQAITAIQSQL